MSSVTLTYRVEIVHFNQDGPYKWTISYEFLRKGNCFARGSQEFKHWRSIARGMKRLATALNIKKIVQK